MRYVPGQLLNHSLVLFSVLTLFISAFFLCSVFSVSAQNASPDQLLIETRKAQLKIELKRLEGLLEQQQVLLSDKRTERTSLERDLAIIDSEVEKARIAIRAQELTISDLEKDIVAKHATILEINQSIEVSMESLANLLRRSAELDDFTGVEIVLSEKTFSEFLTELDEYDSIKLALRDSLAQLSSLKSTNEDARTALEQKKESEGELKQLRVLQEEKLKKQEADKAKILRTTKGEEENYQKLIKSTERSAAQIRAELFELQGSAAIKLGDAIEFAVFAGAKTGVRPALILGVLKQETRLGEFLGNGVWTEDMHPTRDRPVFKVIAETLGVNPASMPVSAKPGYGWGGAMGPAQFIPSTWACYGGYVNTAVGTCRYNGSDTFWAGPWEYRASEDRLRTIRGKQSPSNPWDNQDAFMAAAILMMDNGAAAGTHAAERMAALRYFAGGNASNPAYAFYGDGVMEHAAYYQSQIDTLKQLSL